VQKDGWEDAFEWAQCRKKKGEKEALLPPPPWLPPPNANTQERLSQESRKERKEERGGEDGEVTAVGLKKNDNFVDDGTGDKINMTHLHIVHVENLARKHLSDSIDDKDKTIDSEGMVGGETFGKDCSGITACDDASEKVVQVFADSAPSMTMLPLPPTNEVSIAPKEISTLDMASPPPPAPSLVELKDEARQEGSVSSSVMVAVGNVVEVRDGEADEWEQGEVTQVLDAEKGHVLVRKSVRQPKRISLFQKCFVN
jgi:hypothetical protein